METIKSEQCIAKRLLKYILDGISYEIINVHEFQELFRKEIVIEFTASGYSRINHKPLSIVFVFHRNSPEDQIYVKTILMTTYFGAKLFDKVYRQYRYIDNMLTGRATKGIEELEIKMDLLGI